MGKKLAIGIISTILSVGVIGGICYQDIPAFKTSVNSFFENASNISISIDKDTDDFKDNENEVKPITPEEFLKTYKFELPSTFLGGDLYVKKLTDNNLIISSSVSPGILICDTDTELINQIESQHSSWKFFKELSNGNCLISSSSKSSGLLLYNIQDNTVVDISINLNRIGYNYDFYYQLANGDYFIFGDFTDSSGTSGSNLYLDSDNNITELDFGRKGSELIFELKNGNCLLTSTSTSSSGLYLYNAVDKTFKSIYGGASWKFIELSGKCLMSSTEVAGLYVYNIEDNSVSKLLEDGKGYSYFKLEDGNALVASNVMTSIIYKFNVEDNSLTELYSSGRYCSRYIQLSNGNVLIGSSYNDYSKSSWLLYNSQGNSVTPLDSICYNAKYTVFSNGDILFCASSSGTAGIYLFSLESNTFINIYTTGYNWKYVQELANGDCLIGGAASGGLLYYDSTTCKIRILLPSITVTAIIAQSDGTYLIETSDDFDYEYNPETDTIKLVYTVEQ